MQQGRAIHRLGFTTCAVRLSGRRRPTEARLSMVFTVYRSEPSTCSKPLILNACRRLTAGLQLTLRQVLEPCWVGIALKSDSSCCVVVKICTASAWLYLPFPACFFLISTTLFSSFLPNCSMSLCAFSRASSSADFAVRT